MNLNWAFIFHLKCPMSLGCTIETTGDIATDIEGIFSYEDFC